MFLHRTVQIFNLKNFLVFLGLAAIIIGSVFLVAADPLGRVSYVPDPEDVVSVTIQNETGNPEVIAQVTELHEALIDDRGDRWDTISISYQLKSGKTLRRYYYCPLSGQTNQLAKSVLSRPELVFGTDDFDEFKSDVRWLYVYIDESPVAIVKKGETGYLDAGVFPTVLLDEQALQELLDAIEQDCTEGHMVQKSNLPSSDCAYYTSLSYATHNAEMEFIEIWDNCTHTIQYLNKIAAEHNLEPIGLQEYGY